MVPLIYSHLGGSLPSFNQCWYVLGKTRMGDGQRLRYLHDS